MQRKTRITQDSKLLNLGCGTKYHSDWVNVNLVSTGNGVIACNLLQGVPFKNGEFDVVYHAHILEHFTKKDAAAFLRECHRVLKPGGIIRIVVPDLEMIANNYIKYLNLSLRGDKKAQFKYDWTMLEMYDQCVRRQNGGEMGKMYASGNISDPDFIYKRMGVHIGPPSIRAKLNSYLRFNIKDAILRILFKKEYNYYLLGKVIDKGERHQWMYDRFSLGKLLKQNKFTKIRVCTANESRIPRWNNFKLDINTDGSIYKPDSLYMEAYKL